MGDHAAGWTVCRLVSSSYQSHRIASIFDPRVSQAVNRHPLDFRENGQGMGSQAEGLGCGPRQGFIGHRVDFSALISIKSELPVLTFVRSLKTSVTPYHPRFESHVDGNTLPAERSVFLFRTLLCFVVPCGALLRVQESVFAATFNNSFLSACGQRIGFCCTHVHGFSKADLLCFFCDGIKQQMHQESFASTVLAVDPS